MDNNLNIVLVCFGSVIATMTALCFMELRRIRRHLEGRSTAGSHAPVPAVRAGA